METNHLRELSKENEFQNLLEANFKRNSLINRDNNSLQEKG